MLHSETWFPPLLTLLAGWMVPLPAVVVASAYAALTVAILYPLRRQPVLFSLLTIGIVTDVSADALIQLILIAGTWWIIAAGLEASDWTRVGLVILWGTAALFVSIEFGLVFLLAAVFWAGQAFSGAQRGPAAVIGAGILAASLIVIWTQTAVVETLFRPLSWMTVPGLSLIHSGTRPVGISDMTLSQWLLLATVILPLWHAIRSDSVALSTTGSVLFFAGLGIACRHYLPAAAALAACAACTFPPAEQRSRKWLRSLATALWLGVVGLTIFNHHPILLASSRTRQHIEPELWGISGRVLLFDLDHADFWTQPGREMFSLIADGRWESTKVHPADYAALCDDLVTFRPESYLRTDGQEGGYSRQITKWQVSLIDVPTTRVEWIRQLSITPQCRLIGMDQVRTVFAWADQPELSAVMNDAGMELKSLEWADPSASGENRTFMRFLDRPSRMRVAEALCAGRLPYACLRIAPNDRLPGTAYLRTLAYLELAHRERRHGNGLPLLALARGAFGAQAVHSRFWTVEQRTRIATSLSALELDDVARSLAEPLLSVPARWLCSYEQKQRLTAAIADSTQKKQTTSVGPLAEIYHQLGRGEVAQARPWIEKLPQAERTYYTWLADAVEQPNTQIAADAILQLVTSHPPWPVELQGKAWYDLGCLGLEIGDGRLAEQAFQRSAVLAPSLDFKDMRDFHLRMLARPGQNLLR